MKIKEQTRKLAAGCSKHCFEVVDKTDEVSSKHGFEVADRTDEVSNHTYGKATLTWFEFDFRRVLIQMFFLFQMESNHAPFWVLSPTFYRTNVAGNLSGFF